MTLLFLVHHQEENHDDSKPVDVVRKDRTVCSGVLPSQKGIENVPTVVGFRIAAVDVPYRLADIVSSWTTAVFRSITTSLLIIDVGLKKPDTSREKTSRNEVQDTSGDNQENLHRHGGTGVVQEHTDKDTSDQATNDRDRKGTCRRIQTNTTDEDDGLQAFSQTGDERQDEQGILLSPLA